jgi:hypothetical protein
MRCPISKTRLLDSFNYAARLAHITERLLDDETRLTAAKPTDVERAAEISLREFSSKLLGETEHYSFGGKDIEKYRAALSRSVK